MDHPSVSRASLGDGFEAKSSAHPTRCTGLGEGPRVGGVIGRQRLLFDLWGDTVNLASRMESTGLPGHIQIAASTFQQLPVGRYDLSAHEVDVKRAWSLDDLPAAQCLAWTAVPRDGDG